MGLRIDGIAASQAIDTSGESIVIENLDISSLQEGTAELIYEHKSPKDPGSSPLDILGAITYAKKIFTSKDCANDRELQYWKQIELPFLYIQAELFDDHPGSEALAAIIRWYHKRKLPILMRYSIDGNTLQRNKDNPNLLESCIARSVAITVRPCNQSCVSGVLDDDLEASQEGSLEEVQKNGGWMHRLPGVACWVMPEIGDPMQLIKGEQEFIEESEDLTKTMTAGGYGIAPSALTQGGAQQKEDFATRKKAVRRLQASCRDWDGKGSLKDHLEKTLDDVHPEFIEKFCQALDTFHLKKAADLNALLAKAVAGDFAAAQSQPPGAKPTAAPAPVTDPDATNPGVKPPSQQGNQPPAFTQLPPVIKPGDAVRTAPVKTREQRAVDMAAINADAARSNPDAAKLQAIKAPTAVITNKPVQPKAQRSPALRHAQMAQINAEIRMNNPAAAQMQGVVKSEAPLTAGGAVLEANPGMAASIFDSQTSSLVTPRGTFKCTVPPAGEHPLLERTRAGRRLASGSTSDALRLAALMIGTNRPDHELSALVEHCRGVHADSMHEKLDSLGIDPRSSRLSAALMGSGNVLVPGDECLGGMFGLGTSDTDSHDHLHDTLGTSHRLLQDVEGHVGRALGGMSLQDAVSAWALNDESNGNPAVKVVADVLKAEGASADWTLARRARDLFAKWQQRYGQAKARALFMTHLVPILAGTALVKAEAAPAEATHALPTTVNFRGKKVIPGKVSFHDGHLAGKDFSLLGEDKHRYIVSDHENLGRPMGIPKDDEHRAYKVLAQPVAQQERHLTDASHHVTGSDPNIGVGIDFHPEALKQNKFASEGIHAHYGKPPFFTQNALGQRVFVKQKMDSPWADGEGASTAVREAASKNVADFMGLGDYVPATSVIKHPKTGDMYSVQEVVKNGSHGKAKQEHALAAEKLGAMDFITGQIDRTDLNYMHTDEPQGLKLIDNGYGFRYGEESSRPAYAHKQSLKKDFDPATKAWVSSIDPKGLAETMGKSGLSPWHIKAAVSRLTYLKLLHLSGKPITHDHLSRVIPEGTHPEKQ